MKHSDKWRKTADPFVLSYKHFSLTEILGYPHAGNDVFHVRGRYQNKEMEAYIKGARQHGADLDLRYVYNYLVACKPKTVNKCFCHGDFHYANILWQDKHISAILDFELSGLENKEFDVAWALILRPGQKFLRTKEDKMRSDDPAYQAFIQNVFRKLCTDACP